MLTLRTGGIEYHNKSSAPWTSTEIFTQGCYKGCPGCFNKELRQLTGGNEIPVDYIVQDLIENVPYKRVTFSGGEPFLQAEALSQVAFKLQEKGFYIVCYSGYQAEELPLLFPHARDLIENIDILVDGMFIKELLTPIKNDYDFVGSSNQRIINVQKSLDFGKIILWTEHDTAEVLKGGV
jgi:anaerobic ribonucleoside-triphosphate reductase activating protein